MNPFPFFAVAAALLSGHAGRSPDGYVALAAGDPTRPLLAITGRGVVWSIEPVTRDTTLCIQIASASAFASITRSAAGSFYALSMSGAVARDGRPANDCKTWQDCGLLGGPCEFVALSSGGSPERVVALSACGELYVAGPGSCSWELTSQLPDSSAPFVSLGRTQSGGLYALTKGGCLWRNWNVSVAGERWISEPPLPAQTTPYVAIAGSSPLWALTAAGDLVVRASATVPWSQCGRILPGAGEAFIGLGQDANGTLFALTSGGTVWQATAGVPERNLWRLYAALPPPLGPDPPRMERSDLRLTVTPNPMAGRTAVQLFQPVRGFARLDLHDVAGRIVRTLLADDRESGSVTLSWDGTLDNGARAAPGIYFLRLRCRGLEAITPVLVIR